MDDEPITETVDPEEAFSVLSDPNRIGILRELWRADDLPLSFSELRDLVGVADSGQFNYHLDKLTDQFVRKVDDGYELTAAGIRVVGAVLGGAYTMEGSMEPIDLDEPCPSCGNRWSFRYENEFARMECESCPMTIQYPVQPGTFVGVEPAEMPERTEQYLRTLLEQLRNEVCPHCESEIHPTVVVQEPPDDATKRSSVAFVEYDCTRCSGDLVTDLASPLLTHPAVVSFYYDRGVDVREPSLWEFSAFDEDHTAVDGRDPLRATVTFDVDDDRLSITVDESMRILEIEEP